MPCTEERHTYCLFFFWHVSEVLQCPVDVGCVTSRWQYCSFHIVSICLACPTKQTFLSREDKAFFMCLLSHSMCLLGGHSIFICIFKGTVCLRFCLFALGKWGKCLLILKAVLSGADRICCRFSCVSGTLYLLQLLPTFPLQGVSAFAEQFCIHILEITLGRIILFKQPLPVLLEVN